MEVYTYVTGPVTQKAAEAGRLLECKNSTPGEFTAGCGGKCL